MVKMEVGAPAAGGYSSAPDGGDSLRNTPAFGAAAAPDSALAELVGAPHAAPRKRERGVAGVDVAPTSPRAPGPLSAAARHDPAVSSLVNVSDILTAPPRSRRRTGSPPEGAPYSGDAAGPAPPRRQARSGAGGGGGSGGALRLDAILARPVRPAGATAGDGEDDAEFAMRDEAATAAVLASASAALDAGDDGDGEDDADASVESRRRRKNRREKLRRLEVNGKFLDLTRKVGLPDRAKSNKIAVLSEAVRVIDGLRDSRREAVTERREFAREVENLTACIQHIYASGPVGTRLVEEACGAVNDGVARVTTTAAPAPSARSRAKSRRSHAGEPVRAAPAAPTTVTTRSGRTSRRTPAALAAAAMSAVGGEEEDEKDEEAPRRGALSSSTSSPSTAAGAGASRGRGRNAPSGDTELATGPGASPGPSRPPTLSLPRDTASARRGGKRPASQSGASAPATAPGTDGHPSGDLDAWCGGPAGGSDNNLGEVTDSEDDSESERERRQAQGQGTGSRPPLTAQKRASVVGKLALPNGVMHRAKAAYYSAKLRTALSRTTSGDAPTGSGSGAGSSSGSGDPAEVAEVVGGGAGAVGGAALSDAGDLDLDTFSLLTPRTLPGASPTVEPPASAGSATDAFPSVPSAAPAPAPAPLHASKRPPLPSAGERVLDFSGLELEDMTPLSPIPFPDALAHGGDLGLGGSTHIHCA